MFKFFEGLVDPYAAYPQTDTPPRKMWPFLKDYIRPFRTVFAATALLSVIVAAGDVALIWYVGRVVDLLAQGQPQEIWAQYGTEVILVALAILILRPILAGADVALLHNTILPNFGTMIRWRAHSHVIRQPVGWFESDFAGRIANRIMQTPPAAGDAVFQTFDAVAFASVTLFGAAFMLAEADLRLLLPLLVWFALYALLVRWTLRRAGPASKASSDARSAVTGRVVDSYTNIHSVKLFAHHQNELAYAKEAIETARSTFMKEMRIVTKMDITLTLLNGFLIVAGIGWGMLLLSQGEGVVEEGMETIPHPIGLTDAGDAKPLEFKQGLIQIEGVSHHYGRGSGGLQAVTLTVRPGEKIGVVGRSGAGKSTLVKLMLRFYEAEAGRILIDGQDISQVTQESLRRQIGMVQQDSSLMHRSVRDNIL